MYGSQRGFQGLVFGELREMNRLSVSNIIQQGGSILTSSRCDEFMTEEGRRRAIDNLKHRGIGGVVAIGGNGTMGGCHALICESDIKVVGLPGTIDNDIHGTNSTIGFDTAINTALEAIDRIRDTAGAMERLFFVEVMGRHSGNIALMSGIAGGAEYVLVPETKSDLDDVCKDIVEARRLGKGTYLVVVAEGEEAGGALRGERGGNAAHRHPLLGVRTGAYSARRKPHRLRPLPGHDAGHRRRALPGPR